ncbi:MAG: aconitate hydratase [Anaerolineae bacterium]|jgi:aconitate hydratase
MAKNLTQKIIAAHLVGGEMVSGQEIALKIDQTLTQDTTGTMVWLEFEAMGLPSVRTERSVAYIDHGLIQADFRNPDDHRYLQTVSTKHGAYCSRPGNGICHQVHLERFAAPGKTLLGSDSHTPNAGGLGMLAIGAGGLDVAAAMGGAPFYLTMPKIVGVELTSELGPWVTARDVVLELLRRLSVKGGVGKIMEYYGPGAAELTVDQRSTICNFGAELGATTSIFPSDEQTRIYLEAQERGDVWRALAADPDAEYDEIIKVDLNTLEPLIAKPSMPDKVVKVNEIEGTPVAQVFVGACVNSSYEDLMTLAMVLKGRTAHPDVSLVVGPGSKQVYTMIAKNGALADLIAAGARVLESSCGPCIGMGQAPATGTASVRTSTRNFKGRSGTADDQVYLASPAIAAAAAIYGQITDPRKLGETLQIAYPARFAVNDNMILPPAENPDKMEVVRGPNIKPLPEFRPLSDTIGGRVLIKVGDNITTDDISPAGANILPLRSNLPAISEFVFNLIDPGFVQRAKEWDGGFIVGGANYGQGSSREHAALSPMYLGVEAVIAKSFSRIHHANLINMGILPLVFTSEVDYDVLEQGDEWEVTDVHAALKARQDLTVHNLTQGNTFTLTYSLTERQVAIILSGGLLNYIRDSA